MASVREPTNPLVIEGRWYDQHTLRVTILRRKTTHQAMIRLILKLRADSRNGCVLHIGGVRKFFSCIELEDETEFR